MEKLPQCDFCKMEGIDKPAEYDGRTHTGSWASMCTEHFAEQVWA